MSQSAMQELIKETKINVRKQVGVVELYDCFSCNELLNYEALGLCPIGKAAEFIDKN